MKFKKENEYSTRTIDTCQFPKSVSSDNKLIEPGDIIVPVDGSWAIVVKNGKLYHDAVAYRGKRTAWKVLVTNGTFPTDVSHLNFYPGCRRIYYDLFGQVSHKDNSKHTINDLMCCSVENPNIILFTSSHLVESLETAYIELRENHLRNLRNELYPA